MRVPGHTHGSVLRGDAQREWLHPSVWHPVAGDAPLQQSCVERGMRCETAVALLWVEALQGAVGLDLKCVQRVERSHRGLCEAADSSSVGEAAA